MTVFYVKKKHFFVTAYLPVLLLVLVLGIFVIFSDSVSNAGLTQEKEILEKALNRSMTQCYALEGSYPHTISYLEEQYGLTYNKEHFFIDYQFIGGNLRPDVTIIERD